MSDILIPLIVFAITFSFFLIGAIEMMTGEWHLFSEWYFFLPGIVLMIASGMIVLFKLTGS